MSETKTYHLADVLDRRVGEDERRISVSKKRKLVAFWVTGLVVTLAGALGLALSVIRHEAYEREIFEARIVSEYDRKLSDLAAKNGLFETTLLRQSKKSFLELYSTDTKGQVSYGTAGYIGDGYFITVKHAVVALSDSDYPASTPNPVKKIELIYNGKPITAKVVDVGNAEHEVHSGDWAVLRTEKPLDLPNLAVNTNFAYEFAEPVFRFGNDYSKGILLANGYIGERLDTGLVSCLTDGHPGVSGGGVLDRAGELVGIPIGRMSGDFRFSFILPLRAEMFRKVPREVWENKESSF